MTGKKRRQPSAEKVLLLPGLTGLAAAALPAGVYTVSMYDYDTDREWLLLQDEWLEVTNLPPEQVPEPAVFEFEKEEIYALPVFAPDDLAESDEPAEPADPEQADAGSIPEEASRKKAGDRACCTVPRPFGCAVRIPGRIPGAAGSSRTPPPAGACRNSSPASRRTPCPGGIRPAPSFRRPRR